MANQYLKLAGTSLNTFSIGLKTNLSTITVNGSTFAFNKAIAVDTIQELSSGVGVSVDGVIMKDSEVILGSGGPKLTANGAVIELRNNADNDYASLTVKDLTVQGTTTTIHSTTVTIDDNILVLNANVTGTPTLNAGLNVERGDQTNSALTWIEQGTTGYWSAGIAGSEAEILLSGVATASDIVDFNEAAQDAVGSMIVDTDSINLTYTDESIATISGGITYGTPSPTDTVIFTDLPTDGTKTFTCVASSPGAGEF